MAYSDIALLSSDSDFIQRTRACATTEGEPDPLGWSQAHQWQMAAAPGFGDAYASAIINGIVRPGNDPSVISDGQILSAVQALRSEPNISLSD
jgi:hypothetical protein